MKIRFTKETLGHKPDTASGETGRFLKGSHWLEADGDFDTLVQLYRLGHTVNVSDPDFTDTLILDLDHLTPGQADKVHDDAYIKQLQRQLGVARIERLYSASHVWHKQKLFVNVPTRRDIQENKDLAYIAFRERFEQLTGIECDPRMDIFTQITFGVRHSDAEGLAEPVIAGACPSRQPRASGKHAAKAATRLASEGSSDRLPVSTEPEEFRWVPMNMVAYNKEYGKERREGGRFEWQTRHYGQSPGAIGGHWVKSTVKRGNRHASRARLIAAAVYNALFQNQHYGAGFTLHDVQLTVWKTIQYQFEGSESFLKEEGSEILACTGAEWARAQLVPLEEYYQHLVTVTNAKKLLRYVPRDIAARRLYFQYQDRFAQCGSRAEAKALAGEIAQGEVQLMQKLLYHYKQRCASAPTPRGHFGNYSELLRDAPRTAGGCPIVPLRYRHNTAFRRFLKENGLGPVHYGDG